MVSEATVKIRVRGERVIATAEGNGPVNALDEALRLALTQHYPELTRLRAGRLQGPHPGGQPRHRRGHPGAGGDPSTQGQDWTTVGVHENVVEASWHALVDALTYGLGR